MKQSEVLECKEALRRAFRGVSNLDGFETHVYGEDNSGERECGVTILRARPLPQVTVQAIVACMEGKLERHLQPYELQDAPELDVRTKRAPAMRQ